MPKNTINNLSDPMDATNLTIGEAYTIPNDDGTADQILVTDGAGAATWETVDTQDLIWTEITADTNADISNGYICNATSEIFITLPATFVQGDLIKVVGKNTGSWGVKANTGDTIYYLNQTELSPDPFYPNNVRGCCEVHGITDNAEWEISEKIGEFVSGDVTQVTDGAVHSAFLKSSGYVKTIGLGVHGDLGNNSVTNRTSPDYVVGNHIFDSITSYQSGTLALKADGSVWGWGRNHVGQLGDNSVVSKSSPVSVVGGHSFSVLDSGRNNGIALKADGSCWCWGYNNPGILGDGTIVDKSSPVAVIGGHSFTAVFGGEHYSIALKADGSVWTWGYNNVGQLGDNTITNKSSPVSVTGGHSFIAISANWNTSVALKADGSAWTWGYNDVGQLGDNTSGALANKSSPVAVTGGHSFSAISMTNAQFIGLKADGSIWTCGDNSLGKLGDGTIVNKSSPVSVIGGHSFISLQTSHSSNTLLAIKYDGSVWGCGVNTSYKLGDGTIVNKSSPIQVLNL